MEGKRTVDLVEWFTVSGVGVDVSDEVMYSKGVIMLTSPKMEIEVATSTRPVLSWKELLLIYGYNVT